MESSDFDLSCPVAGDGGSVRSFSGDFLKEFT